MKERRETDFSPPVKYSYWPFQGGASFVDHLYYSCIVLLCFCARLLMDALWSPAGKGLTSWLSVVMSYCVVVTFPLVFWVRCGAWLYRFLIFALFLTFMFYWAYQTLGKATKHLSTWSHFGNEFNKFNDTGAWMLDYNYPADRINTQVIYRS